MSYLLRLDLDLIRRNLESSDGFAFTDDDLYRTLTARGVWRHNDEWWGASEAALANFGEGEILERRQAWAWAWRRCRSGRGSGGSAAGRWGWSR